METRKKSNDCGTGTSYPEMEVPDHVIDTLARCLLPKIQAYFETETGQLAFQEWAKNYTKKEGR